MMRAFALCLCSPLQRWLLFTRERFELFNRKKKLSSQAMTAAPHELSRMQGSCEPPLVALLANTMNTHPSYIIVYRWKNAGWLNNVICRTVKKKEGATDNRYHQRINSLTSDRRKLSREEEYLC